MDILYAKVYVCEWRECEESLCVFWCVYAVVGGGVVDRESPRSAFVACKPHRDSSLTSGSISKRRLFNSLSAAKSPL